MVDRRLLTALVAIAFAGSSGCLGVHVGPIEGTVVDAETGRGIAGVEVFRTYQTDPPQVIGEPSGHRFTPDWTTSGEGGRFEFRGRWILDWQVEGEPAFTWVHPDYGWEHDVRAPLDREERIEIRASRMPERIRHLRETRNPIRGLDEACSRVEGDSAYSHCMSIAYRRERSS